MFKVLLQRAAILLALLLMPATASLADQSTFCMPTGGVVSGLTFAQDVNAGFKAFGTTHSGATAPTNDCTGATLTGQPWLDTSTTPNVLRLYDGAAQQVLGTVDASTGWWTPPVGGGATSVASAATTDLWSVAPAAVTVSGTTTITKLAGSGAVPGTVKFVTFSGALTLTYNVTQLITPTAASITTAAGDTAIVLGLGGGNVKVVDYERASGKALANSVFTGDSGSGGTAGTVPAPGAGSAALGKVLSAGGGFTGNTVPVGASFAYAGVTAPGGYLFEYGQAVSRATYSDLWAVLHSSATVTVTIASPAVVTWTGHPLSVGSTVSFATTGALPTGISAATTYYVIAAGYGTNSFEISATLGGAAINSSGTQSGAHTGTYAPFGAGDFSTTFNVPDMRGRVVAGLDSMGGTSANRLTLARPEGVNGDLLGVAGGEEEHTLSIAEMPAHTHNLTRPNSHGSFTGSQTRWSDGDTASGNTAATTSSAGGDEPHNLIQPTLIQNYIIRY